MRIEINLVFQMPSEVFLELSSGDRCLGRVYINLSIHLRLAQQFLALCLGTQGVSYRGTKANEIRNKGYQGETMLFPCQHKLFTNLGRGDKRTLDEGLIAQYASGHYDRYDRSGFEICTFSSPTTEFNNCFGKISSGLEVVKAAVNCPPNTVTISDCGLVFPKSIIL